MALKIEGPRRQRLPRAIVCAWIASFAGVVGDRMTLEGYLAEMLGCLYLGSHGDWS